MSAIEFNHVWEKYRIKFIKEGKVSWEEVWALGDISFKVDKGEVLGVIGENGAGKTTLLKLIAGMLMPDKGDINVQGKVSTLMELGAGFNPEFTGRENILVNARIYGLDEENLPDRINKIIEFAGLDKFIDAPIKYYSQGMYMRLAFALAIYVEPDILLIDDILAVGDEEAQQKCIKKIFELKQAGKTIILVSHDMHMVSKLCNRVILLEKGRLVSENSSQKIIQHYLECVGDKKGIAVLAKDKLRMVFNNGKINISYDDNLLTKGMGGYVSFFNPSSSAWFPSSNFSWQIKSLSSNKIIAEGINSDGVLSQTWTLQLEDSQLKWQIQINEEAIKESHIDFLFMPQYKRWLTLDKQGDFPAFVQRSNWQDLNIDNPPEGLIGINSAEETGAYPSIILENEDKCGQMRLFNTGYEQESRAIQAYLSKNNIISVNIKIFPDKDSFEGYINDVRQQFLLKQQAEQARLLAEQQAEQARIISLRTLTCGPLRLFADLENKALRLYYKDREITKSKGLDISFFINERWHDNSLAEWQVDKQKDTLVLKFFWQNFAFTQICKFSLKEKGLLWQIENQPNNSFTPDTIKRGFFLSDEYKTFFCGHQQHDFPQEFNQWQDLPLENPQAELFGLKKTNLLPAAVLKNKNDFSCIIQNSDENARCRILQLGPKKTDPGYKNAPFGAELAILEDEGSINAYLEEETRSLLLKEQAEQTRLISLRTISSGSLRLFADVENKVLRLYYKDRELTKNDGLQSIFKVSQRHFLLKDAQWQIEKDSPGELRLFLDYPELSLLQIWTLICENKNILKVKIEIQINKPIAIESKEVRLELTDAYKNWLTADEQGDFSVNQYIHDIGPVRLRNNKVSQILLKSEIDESIPTLSFTVSAHLEKRILGIYKHKEESICLNSSLIIPQKEKLMSGGRYTYFAGSIVFDKDIKIIEEAKVVSDIVLNKGDLRLIFDRGRGRIYWQDKELTGGLSLYTSLRSAGIWYDSYQAIWQVDKKGDNKIVALGDWPFIPISQTWQLELIKKDLIHWRVDMDIYEEVVLEIEQTNLMLSSEYTSWAIPNVNKGKFLNEYTQDYDILPFRFWYGKSKRIGVIGDKLPPILFNCNSADNFFRAIVENTDYLYKARLLQYQKNNVTKLSAKKYTYFEGVIKIGVKE